MTTTTNKERVADLFKTNKVLFYYDIAKRLDLDLREVVDICNKLMKEGVISNMSSRN